MRNSDNVAHFGYRLDLPKPNTKPQMQRPRKSRDHSLMGDRHAYTAVDGFAGVGFWTVSGRHSWQAALPTPKDSKLPVRLTIAPVCKRA